MHLSFDILVKGVEVTSLYWYYSSKKELSGMEEILILGDSQIISGLDPSLVAQREGLALDKVISFARPSEQPEGMLNLYLSKGTHLRHLKKIYINVSPISLSKNSVSDAHEKLFLDFDTWNFSVLKNQYLRKAYFRSPSNFVWKFLNTLFPYLKLNQNYASILGLVDGSFSGYDAESTAHGVGGSFKGLSLLKSRFVESNFISEIVFQNKAWTWKHFAELSLEEPSLSRDNPFPKGSSQAFAKPREISLQLFQELILQAHKRKVEVVCLDLPFSPALEADMKGFHLRDTLKRSKEQIPCDKWINVPADLLDQPEDFKDFTHLNQRGREKLNRFLLSRE
ncbi:hypothetical protein LPTSP4_20780 [Leptospira ryugenii]|uniref:GDSL-like lipase/acylhydrolase family protein n=1 Tax=Leptospira ryugenii TaxID=1917863 RepID=A0A2P2E106_9LEPT|nr:hypothetical protein [Leptospira ryugenii]GBF50552.1 hypothetical protein LPTSP4_20780 [Leptospira ryugenii]